jgi:diguanylate cyclase (GGDEF)-like protein
MRLLRPHRLADKGPMFGLRLFLSFAVAVALLGFVGYRLILHELRTSQIESYSATQRTDAASLEAVAAAAGSKAGAIRQIDEFIDVIAKRPGTLETLLVDQRGVVVGAGHDVHVGEVETDPRIEDALVRGREYAGHEDNPSLDQRDFEFVMPVRMPGERFAYEVTYGHRAFDAQLNRLRRILFVVGLLTLVGGGGVFYLVGGRTLMRHHRLALQRATRDGLTDLPNQGAFQDEFPHAVANALRHEETLALAVMDLDDFKFVNDRHGHHQGDDLLKRVAAVLRDGRPGDRVYRNGGDEFAALLPHTDGEGARVFARRLQRAMTEAGLRMSIGVSAQRAGQPADSLRAEAEAALTEAKRRGGNQHTLFDDIRESAVVTTLEQKGAVRKLIEEGKVTTLFQPIWDLAAGKLLGVEALSRPDPSYELSGPFEAFDLAEQIGRVHELDVICANQALSSMPPLPPEALLFLNICPQTLDLDEDRSDWILRAVERAQLAPERVVIEVTERFGARTNSVIKALTHLRAQGFKIALDDVGTGNAGLEMLLKVHAQYVKLDGSIVSAAVTEQGARAVMMAMATFARQTGAYVIAEGIEDEETLQFLRSIDHLGVRPSRIIQGGQGYGLGRPSATIQTSSPQSLSETPVAA